MQSNAKIILEMGCGQLLRVYSSLPLTFIEINYDLLDNAPVKVSPQQPEVVHLNLYELYDSDTPFGLQIREALQHLNF